VKRLGSVAAHCLEGAATGGRESGVRHRSEGGEDSRSKESTPPGGSFIFSHWKGDLAVAILEREKKGGKNAGAGDLMPSWRRNEQRHGVPPERKKRTEGQKKKKKTGAPRLEATAIAREGIEGRTNRPLPAVGKGSAKERGDSSFERKKPLLTIFEEATRTGEKSGVREKRRRRSPQLFSLPWRERL